MRGTQSNAVDGALLESMAQRRPSTLLVSLEAGHVTHHDDAAGFNAAVRQFLRELACSAGRYRSTLYQARAFSSSNGSSFGLASNLRAIPRIARGAFSSRAGAGQALSMSSYVIPD